MPHLLSRTRTSKPPRTAATITADAAALGYVPLPHAVQQLATTTLASVTGPGGQPLTG